MRKLTVTLLMALLTCAFSMGCGDSATAPSQMGTLEVSLTDAPGIYEAVNVTFSEISANIDGEWIAVRDQAPITVNLLDWNNGNSMVLGTAEVPSGHYTQIRVTIDAAEVIADGNPYEVTVPSGALTGLKLLADFTVNAGSTYELILDFDVQRSIVTTGPPNNPTGYLLKPTIRVEEKALTGSISGMLTNPENNPVAYAMAGSDTLTSTRVDTNGSFRLAFLPAGLYSVSIADTLNLTYASPEAEVVVGSDNDLGNITLQ